ncbi:MAG: hypothetical protein [Microviridae sp.]|nr:MAG: hypothetical protein [Microviridae sp.]
MGEYKNGKFYPDPTPVAIPLKYTRQSSYNETIRDMIRSEQLNRDLHAAGVETFEEANDFNVGDDVDSEFGMGHEEVHDPVDEEVIRRLTSDEYAQKVEERLLQVEPFVKKKPRAKPAAKAKEAMPEPDASPPGEPKSEPGS